MLAALITAAVADDTGPDVVTLLLIRLPKAS
jgi:hypothetical protein